MWIGIAVIDTVLRRISIFTVEISSFTIRVRMVLISTNICAVDNSCLQRKNTLKEKRNRGVPDLLNFVSKHVCLDLSSHNITKETFI